MPKLLYLICNPEGLPRFVWSPANGTVFQTMGDAEAMRKEVPHATAVVGKDGAWHIVKIDNPLL